MAVYKCKMCAGVLNVTEGMTVCECEYCGTTQTIPRTDNEQTVNMFNRANHFRQQCEFDKAAEIYEKMTAQRDDAELYWSIVLCRYGIEYVDDPRTKKKIPTCHRTQYKSILDDADYLQAIAHADMHQKIIYEQEAAYIDKIQKKTLEISNKEEPFDIFICYKETDDKGRRTPDSVLAQELYYGLLRENFKVFFSRITLESKLGTEYEPYIFAALNSAKVMVVVGTKPEYYNSVWVKNEWNRYLMLMQDNRGKTLIPAYKDMDPYDLPDELSMFQAQDMSKLGFMQDLIHGIKKIVKSDEPAKTVVKETVVHTAANSGVSSLLKRVSMFLDDGDWNSAEQYCEKVLDIDPENAQAYYYKLLAKKRLTEENALSAGIDDLRNESLYITNDPDYKKAYKFGDDAMKAKLNEIHCSMIYNGASKTMEKAESYTDYKYAVEKFREIAGYRDSEEKITECENAARENIYQSAARSLKTADDLAGYRNALKNLSSSEIVEYKDVPELIEKCRGYMEYQEIYDKASAEMKNPGIESKKAAAAAFESISGFKNADMLAAECRRQEAEYIAFNVRKARMRRIGIIASISCVVLIGVCFTINTVIIPMINYNNAVKLEKSGEYEAAAAEYEKLGDYKDCGTRLGKVNSVIEEIEASRVKYAEAEKLQKNGSYIEAVDAYMQVSELDTENYQNVQTKIAECKKSYAEKVLKEYDECIKSDDFTGALKLLAGIDDEFLTDEIRAKSEELKEDYFSSMNKAVNRYLYFDNYLGALDYIQKNRIEDIESSQIDELCDGLKAQYVSSILSQADSILSQADEYSQADKFSKSQTYLRCIKLLEDAVNNCETYDIDSKEISVKYERVLKLYDMI